MGKLEETSKQNQAASKYEEVKLLVSDSFQATRVCVCVCMCACVWIYSMFSPRPLFILLSRHHRSHPATVTAAAAATAAAVGARARAAAAHTGTARAPTANGQGALLLRGAQQIRCKGGRRRPNVCTCVCARARVCVLHKQPAAFLPCAPFCCCCCCCALLGDVQRSRSTCGVCPMERF